MRMKTINSYPSKILKLSRRKLWPPWPRSWPTSERCTCSSRPSPLSSIKSWISCWRQPCSPPRSSGSPVSTWQSTSSPQPWSCGTSFKRKRVGEFWQVFIYSSFKKLSIDCYFVIPNCHFNWQKNYSFVCKANRYWFIRQL